MVFKCSIRECQLYFYYDVSFSSAARGVEVPLPYDSDFDSDGYPDPLRKPQPWPESDSDSEPERPSAETLYMLYLIDHCSQQEIHELYNTGKIRMLLHAGS